MLKIARFYTLREYKCGREALEGVVAVVAAGCFLSMAQHGVVVSASGNHLGLVCSVTIAEVAAIQGRMATVHGLCLG
jgi:hypothetical protein